MSTAASLGAAYKHSQDGDVGSTVLSLVGALPVVGSLGGKAVSAGLRYGAGSVSATTRAVKLGAGRAARNFAFWSDRIGDFWTGATAGYEGATSVRCSVIGGWSGR